MLVTNDVVVGIVTGQPFYKTRAKACKETWGKSFPFLYFYSGIPEDSLPVISLGLVGEDYQSALAKFLLALKDMWKRHPDKSWFMICGCDTYVFSENLLKVLARYDRNKPMLIGGNLVNVEKLPEIGSFAYPSGGGGQVISNSLMNKLCPFLDDLLLEWPIVAKESASAVDAAVAWCAKKKLGILPTEEIGFFFRNPFEFKGSSSFSFKHINELVSLHYVRPKIMYLLYRYRNFSFFVLYLRASLNILIRSLNSIRLLYQQISYNNTGLDLNKLNLMQCLVKRLKAKTYLEIGVNTGKCFLRLKVRRKIGVDPMFIISFKRKVFSCLTNYLNLFNEYYQMTSDVFYRSRAKSVLRGKVDVVLVDGLHTYKQALNDILNSLDYLSDGGVIIVDDCNPSSELMASQFNSYDDYVRSHLRQWCGDVWKAIVYLRSRRNDLRIFVLDCETGIGIITRGQPESMLNYSDSDIEALTYKNLLSQRSDLLNLKREAYFKDFLGSLSHIRRLNSR